MPAKRENIIAGMRRGAAKGRVSTGRSPKVSDAAIRAVLHLGTLAAARKVGLSKSQFINRRRRLEDQPHGE